MKLLTNENNPEAVKILIAGEISQRRIQIALTAVTDRSNDGVKCPKRLPQLVLDSGVCLFSSNTSVKYLLPATENESVVNYYLDYEANVIQPLIISCSGKLDAKTQTNFENALNKLNEALTSEEYLTGSKISAADVSIWSTLYPVATDLKLSGDFLSKRVSLKNWFDKLHKLPSVASALKLYPVSNGVASLSNLSSVHWFPAMTINKIWSGAERGSDAAGQEKQASSAPQVTDEEVKSASEAWSSRGRRKPKQAVHPVLPVPGERNILITSALPYVNNVPHLGNIIGCVLSGDVFARYCRLRNYNTLYICGTDEYGTATETKALEEGLTPKQICDKYFEIHDRIYKWFNIKFDRFGRTTTPEQAEISQDLFLKLYKNGFIASDSVEQLLCEKCDRYLADRFVEGTCPRCAYEDARGDQCDGCGHLINATELIKPRCKMCQQTPVLRHSKQFFLDLPKIEPELKKWMEDTSGTWSHNAREISRAWVNDGLKPRCITRDLKWGIPVPLEGYENKVFYVWFDAPIGYISITKQYTSDWKKWWMTDEKTDVKLYQFMAKDNVPFHSVLFPSSLIGSREKFILVDNIFATEYLNYEDGKFSKSRGVGVFGTDAQDTGIPADIWRFYLLYVRPESQDSSFSWQDLALKNNSELLNILGNFINRALVFAEKNYGGKVPDMNLVREDYELLAQVNRELSGYIAALEKGKLRDGIRHILSIARLGNLLMQTSQPWVLFKGNADEQKRGATVIGLSVNLSCFLSVLLYPYMPDTSETIQKQLNAPSDVNVIEDRFALLLQPGHAIGKPSPLFTKIEMTQIDQLKTRFSGRQKSKTPDGKDARKASSPTSVSSAAGDVASLEAAVSAQGNLVRQMKSSGKDKSEWQPQVAILLDLKKKLEAAKAAAPAPQAVTVPPTSVTSSSGDVAELEKAVAEQGNLVRQMKSSGKDRSEWQPEVNVLLDLKKKLEAAKASAPAQTTTTTPAPAQSGADGDVSGLEKAVEDQGNVVRKMKESGMERSQWQPELNKLLELKKQLAEAKGEPAAPSSGGKKGKKAK